MVEREEYLRLKEELGGQVELVAVSKRQPLEKLHVLYEYGQYVYGENYVQALRERNDQLRLPGLKWHMIGHLQSNKVKYIAPFIDLIQSVDRFDLLEVLNKEALKIGRIIDCLLQIHIASEETKYGFSYDEIKKELEKKILPDYTNIRIRGLMGMATFTDEMKVVGNEFRSLRRFFDEVKSAFFDNAEMFNILSMGMTDDYKIAIEEGSTMVRIGTLLFGERENR